jgi:hypothetical protein
MGTLFPDDDEYPDYEPLPAGHEHVSGKYLYVGLGVFIATRDLCPKVQTQPDPPQREVYQLWPAAAQQVSTGGDLQIAIPNEALHVTETMPTLAVSSS